ncbi:SDR family NAD(P)-dependent oxidoreductase [Candidatus Woesearchaeota archaeon]|nr:SDR family NAD(P)-dependent oxidoreductase [Candidatus Woesearchaeota archaeon]
MKHSFKKTAIVTGVSKGLGSHIASYLSKSEFNLVLTYNSNKNAAEKVFKDISKRTRSELLKCDITEYSDVMSVVNKAIKGLELCNSNQSVWDFLFFKSCIAHNEKTKIWKNN